MDSAGLIGLVIIVSIIAVLVDRWLGQWKRLEDAKKWPVTEATIQTGNMEAAHSSRSTLRVPVFGFSYIVDEKYYSGRFALAWCTEPIESLMKRLIDTKLTIHYDPRQPSSYFIPDEMIEGCLVRQKMDPYLFRIYPVY